MLESQLSNPRKRQYAEQCPLHLNGASQPQSKRQKLSHPTTGSQPPAAFWDNLSKIWLTKTALRELNRRNSQSASSLPRSQYRRARRPVTRNILAESKRNRRFPQSASDFLRHCEPGTLKDIELFARYGGPDLSDLKGFPKPVDPLNHTMGTKKSSSRGRKRGSASTLDTRPTTNTTETKTTESSGPYSRNFQQKLIDGGIYPDEYEYPDGRVPPEPDNLEVINQRLAQPRSSLSPSRFSHEKFREFKRADAHVSKENKATKSVIPIIEGKIADDKCVEGDILFTNLTSLIDDTLTAAKPDLYYGARPEQLDRQVRNELSGHIIPSTQDDLPIAPNFFLAAKGPDGTAAVARRQACYDGALGARGMHSLQSYGEGGPAYDNKAYTITSIYSDGQLKIYTSHPTQPTSPGGRPEYCMNQLRSFAMTDTADTFRQGATAYRNARDWAKEQRDEAITRANERANDSQAGTPTQPTSPGGRPEYCMTQLGAYAMTHNRESFRQGATAYRNARDWAKEQRGEAIACANEKANDKFAGAPAAGLSMVSSFTREASLDEVYTTEALSRDSRTSLDEGSNITANLQESETSTDELVLDYKLPVKRSSKRSHQPQRKRRNGSESGGGSRGTTISPP